MPYDTHEEIREFYKLQEQLEQLVQQDPAYAEFLEAVKNTQVMISRMNTPDRYGRMPTVGKQERQELMRLHREIGAKAETIFRGQSKKERKDLVKKITALAAGNHRALMQYDPEKPKTLSRLLSEVRTLSLDSRGAALRSKVGNQSNTRQPLTFLDDKGREITGVFTPKTVINVGESIQAKIDQIKPGVRDPVGRQILDNFLETLIAWGAKQEKTDIRGWPEGRKLAMLDSFAQGIATGDAMNVLNRDAMKEAMNEIFADQLHGASITAKIPKKLLWELGQTVCDQLVNINVNMHSGKIPDGARLDTRNAAMSAVADLLGVPNLLARSRPMTLTLPDGSQVEGTFMAEGKGLDPRNLSEQAAGIDEKACVGTTEDEKAAVGKGFKDLADLQILDYLCGNVDRNWANMLFQFTDGKKFRGTQGIDNDCALGLTMPTADQEEKEMAALNKMSAISASMENAVMELTPETLRFALQGFELSEKELDAAAYRLNTLKEKLAADRQSRIQGHGLMDGFIRKLEDHEWSDYSLKSLAATRRVRNAEGKVEKEPANIFATAVSPIFDMGKDYANQKEAYRSLKSEIAIGADNRAIPAAQGKHASAARKLAELLEQRTTQGRSSPQYDAMQEAVEKYALFQLQLRNRMEEAAKDQKDPDAVYDSIVSSQDLEQMRQLGLKIKETAQAYLTHKGGGLHVGYTAKRIEAAKLALAFGSKTAQLSDVELESAERNEKDALAELRQRAGDSLEAAEKAGKENPFFVRGEAEPAAGRALAPQTGR